MKFLSFGKILTQGTVYKFQYSNLGEGGVKKTRKNSKVFYGQPLKKSQLELCVVICLLFFIFEKLDALQSGTHFKNEEL